MSDRAPLVFRTIAAVVRTVPNNPKRFRALLSYRIAPHRIRGRMVVPVGGGVKLDLQLEDWLQRLYALGETDHERRAILRRFVPVGGTFIDVGANVGLYTCSLAAHVGPGGRVLAFEPLPINARALRSNVALNRLTNVSVYEMALSRRAEELELFAPAGHPGTRSNATSRERDKSISLGPVHAAALDDIFECPRLDGLKLDVEGHELEVLAGASGTLDRFRPVIQCEVIFEDVLEGLRSLAKDLDYRIYQEGRRGGLAPFDVSSSPSEAFLIPEGRTVAT